MWICMNKHVHVHWNTHVERTWKQLERQWKHKKVWYIENFSCIGFMYLTMRKATVTSIGTSPNFILIFLFLKKTSENYQILFKWQLSKFVFAFPYISFISEKN